MLSMEQLKIGVVIDRAITDLAVIGKAVLKIWLAIGGAVEVVIDRAKASYGHPPLLGYSLFFTLALCVYKAALTPVVSGTHI